MNECKFSTSALVDYLEKRQKDSSMPLPPELAEHMRNCPACARIVAEESMAIAFIRLFRGRLQKEVATGTYQADRPSAVVPGQIWRFFFGPDKQSDFCLITSNPFKASADLDSAVRIAPLFLSPRREETDGSDLIVSSQSNPLGVPLLVEYWNERPLLCRQLMEYAGELEPVVMESFSRLLAADSPEPANSRIRVFRQHEIARAATFSEEAFNGLLASEANPAPEEEWLFNGIRVIYHRLRKTLKEISPIAHEEVRYSLRHREPTAIYAATKTLPKENLDKLYQLLCAFLKDRPDFPVRIRQTANHSLKLVNFEKKDFWLTLQTSDGNIVETASSGGECLIRLDDPPAALDYSIITAIIFKEK